MPASGPCRPAWGKVAIVSLDMVLSCIKTPADKPSKVKNIPVLSILRKSTLMFDYSTILYLKLKKPEKKNKVVGSRKEKYQKMKTNKVPEDKKYDLFQ